MKRRKTYRDQLEARRRRAAEASAQKPVGQKDPSQMSDGELEQEIQRARAEERRLSEQAVRMVREGASDRGASGSGRHPIFAPKKRRAPWK